MQQKETKYMMCHDRIRMISDHHDHSAFLQTDILTRRPEQLSVEDFIHLTNQVAALYS